MRLALISHGRSDDPRHFSGACWHALAEMRRQGAEVFPLDATSAPWSRWLAKKKNLLTLKFYGELHHPDADSAVLWTRSRGLAAQVRQLRPDAVLCHGQPEAAAAIPANFPLYVWTDAMFPGIRRTHEYCRVYYGARDARYLHRLENRVLRRCRRIWLTSEWAARDTRADFPEAAAHVCVQPFGANLANPPEVAAVEQSITRRNLAAPILFFLALRWESKGGDEALATVKRLRDQGCPARLAVAGPAVKPSNVPDAPWIDWAGPLDKRKPEEAQRLNRLLAESAFLVLPSPADCVPNVCTEAAAFGLPVAATTVGGMLTAVSPNENGMLFPLANFVDEAAPWIAEVSRDRARYEAMARAARRRFETTLNWSVNVRDVLAAITSDVGSTRP
jgi:glycosyltransferase involved in cell wall biosynthesis